MFSGIRSSLGKGTPPPVCAIGTLSALRNVAGFAPGGVRSMCANAEILPEARLEGEIASNKVRDHVPQVEPSSANLARNWPNPGPKSEGRVARGSAPKCPRPGIWSNIRQRARSARARAPPRGIWRPPSGGGARRGLELNWLKRMARCASTPASHARAPRHKTDDKKPAPRPDVDEAIHEDTRTGCPPLDKSTPPQGFNLLFSSVGRRK